MNLADQLTAQGLKAHNDVLDIAKLKLGHIKKRFKSYEPTYLHILALIRLDNNRYRTAILDEHQGLIAVPESPTKILKTMSQQLELISPWFMHILADFTGIKCYRPYVYGGMSFSPLKTNANGCQSWISTIHIKGIQPHTSYDSNYILFKDLSTRIIVPESKNFIDNRIMDAANLQVTHNAIVEALSLPTSGDFQDTFKRLKISPFHKNLAELFANAKTDIIKKAWDRAEFEYTDEDIDRLIKEQLSD